MFDMMDEAIANDLGVSVGEYVDKIERTTPHRMEVIVMGLFSEDDLIIEKAKRIFNLIQE